MAMAMPDTASVTDRSVTRIDFQPGLYDFEIRSSDTDFSDRLQISSLFALMQESAYHHAEQLGIGTSLLDELDLTWMLSKISVRLHQLPRWGEKVWIRTWSRGARRLLFQRDFEFMSGSPDAPPFGQGTSEWLVVRQDNHRPQRPEMVFSSCGMAMAAELPAVLDFQCPKVNSLIEPGTTQRKPDLLKFADFSEIDRNRHVNNTRYIAWSMDAAYAILAGGLQNLANPDAQALELKAIDINYLSEIRPGERIGLFVDRHDFTAGPAGDQPAGDRSAGKTGRIVTVEGLKADPWTASFRALLQFA